MQLTFHVRLVHLFLPLQDLSLLFSAESVFNATSAERSFLTRGAFFSNHESDGDRDRTAAAAAAATAARPPLPCSDLAPRS